MLLDRGLHEDVPSVKEGEGWVMQGLLATDGAIALFMFIFKIGPERATPGYSVIGWASAVD